MLKKKIQALCKEHGISVTSLENKCGIGHGTIAKWDGSAPTISTLKKIADYFEIPICEIVEDYDG